ncbi:phage tail tip lysozyme [Enterococcus rivorum]|uniref:Phage tail lysozyme domain-containing protein n=1 Tax=Enterococcus rivorum TaxID=762845 RepID=A0A1E5KXG7_9ENTE|nr:phage tail tip lysozyme [Enterococcus rivorum]MBP2099865.1 hypothetical protein [Enterococcus rivorum]OEH82518.1 hypothetical protein BCR26_13170 [Enterococcus rivorum]
MTTQLETAKQIWNYLSSKGWSQESVAALLGNMQSESGIIPDCWESDIIGNMSGGYGLVQWTPATKYINWAKTNGLVYQDVISQCKRLEWEVENNQQFQHPSMTFKQFSQSKQMPEFLADIFIRYYERPANPNQPIRQTQARYWFNLLKTIQNKGEVTMQCIYSKGKAMYYFTGDKVKILTDPAQVTILKTIYRDNNGKDMPVYDWSGTNPTSDLLLTALKNNLAG